MDWMVEKLRNLALSPLPVVASTPLSAAILEEVPINASVSENIEEGSSKQITNVSSGYFLRSGTKHPLGGIGKDPPLGPRGRGRKSFLAKAQMRAKVDLSERKQLSIERALRAVQAQKKGHR